LEPVTVALLARSKAAGAPNKAEKKNGWKRTSALSYIFASCSDSCIFVRATVTLEVTLTVTVTKTLRGTLTVTLRVPLTVTIKVTQTVRLTVT
jgi:subtilisin-like proprotein convertase family protein